MKLVDDDNGGKIGVCVVRTCLDEQLLLDHSFNIHPFATASMPPTSSSTSLPGSDRDISEKVI